MPPIYRKIDKNGNLMINFDLLLNSLSEDFIIWVTYEIYNLDDGYKILEAKFAREVGYDGYKILLRLFQNITSLFN